MPAYKRAREDSWHAFFRELGVTLPPTEKAKHLQMQAAKKTYAAADFSNLLNVVYNQQRLVGNKRPYSAASI